jgi:Family of unknown function (DUF5681)
MTVRNTRSAPYEVGYCKPPRHTQFRKGRSGNPRGRPPRDPAKRLTALVLREVYRGTALQENGRTVRATAMQAILRSRIDLAANGDAQAQRDILKEIRKIEEDNASEQRLAEMQGIEPGRR